MKKFDAVLTDEKGNKIVKTSWFCETFDEAEQWFSKWRDEGTIDKLCKTVEDTELSYMSFVNDILANTVRTIYDYRNRPVSLFKIDENTHIPVRLLQTDGFYYGKCEVQEINIDPVTLKEKDCFGSLVRPITWDLMSCEDFLNIYKYQIEFIEYDKRKYGQPKLSKPTELKGIKQFFSVAFNNKCTCPTFVSGDDIFIKHKDYFSEQFRPPLEDIGKPLIYISKKYFNKDTTKEFIYPDNWSSVVLRNEAWLCLKNLARQMQYLDEIRLQFEVKQAINKFYKDKYGLSEIMNGVGDMSRFYETLVHDLYLHFNEQQRISKKK